MTAAERIEKIKIALGFTPKYNQIQVTDKSYVEFQGESIALGTQVYQVSGTNRNLCPDGIWKSFDGKIQFTIADGKVSDLNPNPVVATVETPILQAQSSQEATTEATESEVKLADATATVDIVSLVERISALESGLSNLQDAISNLATLYVTQENFSKVEKVLNTTNEAVNGIVETVEILANQPSAAPIEKEVINLAVHKVPKDIKDSMNYKIMQKAFNQ